MSDNGKLFDAGMDKAADLIKKHLADILSETAAAAVYYAMGNHKGFKNFTGNTHTGYGGGVYADGKLQGYSLSANYDKAPVRVKLVGAEKVTLEPDYDGKNRTFTGSILTDGGFGRVYAVNFLKSHKPNVRNGLALTVTTGTEYSYYLEAFRHADVLTGTRQNIENIFQSCIKPIS